MFCQVPTVWRCVLPGSDCLAVCFARFRLFPPRHRFLTEEEYLQQGEVETRNALKDLREYCRSPDCNAWKVVSRLKSPARSVQAPSPFPPLPPPFSPPSGCMPGISAGKVVDQRYADNNNDNNKKLKTEITASVQGNKSKHTRGSKLDLCEGGSFSPKIFKSDID